jgi:hypothetical protein
MLVPINYWGTFTIFCLVNADLSVYLSNCDCVSKSKSAGHKSPHTIAQGWN